jgi:hypothetical protein
MLFGFSFKKAIDCHKNRNNVHMLFTILWGGAELYKILKSLVLTGSILGASLIAGNANAADTLFEQYVGNYGVATSGWGSITQSGTISTTVPIGSTVVAAYLYSSTFNSSTPGGTLGGTAVNYNVALGVNPTACCSLQAYQANVTSIVAPIINGGPGGTYNFSITETNSNQDGEALVVVYTNPANPVQTVAILHGFASAAGDTATINFATPLNPSDPGFFAHMAIGDGFSCCNQKSEISVNGLLMTTAAGNNDDSADAFISDGNLITVGNINGPFTGGTPGLPQTNYLNDHEAYDLAPFITNGDTSISITTANASLNDNIFLIVFNTSGEANVVTPGIPEPSTWAMMILGFAGVGFMAYRRSRKNDGLALTAA